jgi:bifunctional enzyme CysN/CysC
VFSPGGKTSTVARIERWNSPERKEAGPGESIGLSLTDQIFVERGHVATHERDGACEGQQFRARIFWIHEEKLRPGAPITVRLLSQETTAEVMAIEKVVDATTLSEVRRPAGEAYVGRHEVAEVSIRTKKPLAFDVGGQIAPTSRFAIYTGRAPTGGGVILPDRYFQRGREGGVAANLFWSTGRINRAAREARNGHPGLVVWLTGLSGSGKSTIAAELERQLFLSGRQVYLIDGDNLRHGLNAGLSFAAADRTENIRRAGEAAKLVADAGLIVITAFISPFAADRDRVRASLPAGRFVEVFVNAPLDVCKVRDPKGLYARAERGEIKEFTGVSSPYEAPTAPEIEVRTDQLTAAQAVERLLEFLAPRLDLERGPDI